MRWKKKRQPAWQRFEHLAQQIQAELAPTAIVARDEKLRGKSSVLHQCDVVVRSKVGQFEFVCVLECKDLAENVGLDIARSFAARIDDLGVSQGVLVSARGYTEDALTFLKSAGILAYTLLDAESEKWSEAAIVPVVAEFVWMRECEVEFTNSISGKKLYFDRSTNFDTVPMVEVRNSRQLTVKEYLQERWDEACCQPIMSERREFTDISNCFAVAVAVELLPVRATIAFAPATTIHYGYIPLTRGRGFVDVSSGAVLLGGDFETGDVFFDEVRRDWPHVESTTDLPVKRPVLRLVTPALFARPEHPLEGFRLEARRLSK